MPIGLWDVEALTDGGEVISPTRFTPKNIPGTNFCWGLSQPQGHSPSGWKDYVNCKKKKKNPITLSEPATFRLVAQRLNQLRRFGTRQEVTVLA
jgi:hypothetical protein